MIWLISLIYNRLALVAYLITQKFTTTSSLDISSDGFVGVRGSESLLSA
jgi:hypothetical protein